MTEYQIPGRVPDDSTPRDAVSNYWRERYTAEPYYDDQLFFEDYEPAYRIGHAARAQDMIRAYEQVEAELRSRLGIGCDAAGIIVRGAGDKARSELFEDRPVCTAGRRRLFVFHRGDRAFRRRIGHAQEAPRTKGARLPVTRRGGPHRG